MPDGSAARKIRFPRLCIQLVCALALWLAVACVHAASIYQCVDAHGHLAYRDTPCAPHARQNKLDVQPLPTIGDPAEVAAQRSRQTKANRRSAHDGRHAHTAHTTRRRANTKQEMSWECRAADGEVFYRHARCPSSVPGDGVVRDSYEENMASTRRRGRGRRDAWAGVRVHGKKVTRAEACRRIHAAGAAGRDGHQRDQTVSTYDHLMGRDPCGD